MEKSQNGNRSINIPLKKRITLLSGDGSWNTHGITKYGVPALTMNDGPAGLRKPLSKGETPSNLNDVGANNTYKATCFPSAALNACSWDPSLMEEFGKAIANECKAHGTNIILAPGVNIKRNPLGGRNFEYLSEDPLLAGKMAAAFINGCQNNGVGACLKHYALNEQETRRFTYTAEVDERALHELYLKPFEIAVKESNPWMVMASYNRINGIYGCANKYLLKDVLKGDWNYDGVVVSDWGAVEKVIESHKNGLDLEMPCYNSKDRNKVLLKAVKRHQLSISDVKDSTSRIVKLTERCANTPKEEGKYEENHQLAIKMAEKSIVLTQNDDILPLDNYDDVCVIGAFAEKARIQAGGSSHVETLRNPSFLEIINKDREKPVPYEPGYSLGKVSEDAQTAMNFDACDLASTHKKVILFLGVPESYESEGYDKESMRLPNEQYRLFENIVALNENVIVVLCSGSPVELSSVSRAKGLLITYLYGEGGSEALSNIILGKANPSGKLAESWPIRYLDCPSSTFYPGNNDFSLYKESIFVGYRYYVTADKKTQYPFGYGLSYTNFEYSDISLSLKNLDEGKKVTISINVKNTGERDGEEIVEAYVSNLSSNLYREKRALKAFNKVSIKAGSSKNVKLVIQYDDLAIWSREKNCFIVEEGDYLIEVGSSSENILLSAKIHVNSPFKPVSEVFKLPNYYSISAKRPFSLVDDEFVYLLGRDYINDLPNKSNKITLNSTFGDIADTKIGKTCIKLFKKHFAEEFKDENVMNNQLSSLMDTPIRCASMGEISDKYTLTIVALANHKYFTAIKELLIGKRK